ncbi:hypothetical protein Clacol_000230 [Clathrus columnatus]|uniref:Uncharacterized protein n=1 Tax=Clathrus columnatus TaxID=1419009 RepID=A0AAV4ZYA1_9AGAM|nr:hypothetical protein Clacol_000230 [Clathrus columnatus]
MVIPAIKVIPPTPTPSILVRFPPFYSTAFGNGNALNCQWVFDKETTLGQTKIPPPPADWIRPPYNYDLSSHYHVLENIPAGFQY